MTNKVVPFLFQQAVRASRRRLPSGRQCDAKAMPFAGSLEDPGGGRPMTLLMLSDARRTPLAPEGHVEAISPPPPPPSPPPPPTAGDHRRSSLDDAAQPLPVQ